MSEFLHVLLVDDDEDVLRQLEALLPDSLVSSAAVHGFNLDVVIDSCSDFSEAIRKIRLVRYDLVISDIYQKQAGGGNQADENARARGVVDEIKKTRFSPILLYTSSSRPEWLEDGVFLRYVDKAGGDEEELVKQAVELIRTGIPTAARAIHDSIDSQSAQYIWDFFEEYHTQLANDGGASASEMERVLRRRVATSMSRIDAGTGSEASKVHGIEYYIFPKIAKDEYRLGEIVSVSSDYRIILTPHCQLHVQRGSNRPKADYVLTAKLEPAGTVLEECSITKPGDLRRALSGKFGKPEGRYFFLPRFLSMGDSFCDFMQLESISLERLETEFKPHAVLDTPFAESLQARFASFYGSVGTPDLDSDELAVRLLPQRSG
ncbi:hypothetical protein [Algiphilus sp.]|uniref:hypothetical protein n=1 Tax=Algiphilus sp. TaxID=1872431 RepID=UPI003BAD5BED